MKCTRRLTCGTVLHYCFAVFRFALVMQEEIARMKAEFEAQRSSAQAPSTDAAARDGAQRAAHVSNLCTMGFDRRSLFPL